MVPARQPLNCRSPREVRSQSEVPRRTGRVFKPPLVRHRRRAKHGGMHARSGLDSIQREEAKRNNGPVFYSGSGRHKLCSGSGILMASTSQCPHVRARAIARAVGQAGYFCGVEADSHGGGRVCFRSKLVPIRALGLRLFRRCSDQGRTGDRPAAAQRHGWLCEQFVGAAGRPNERDRIAGRGQQTVQVYSSLTPPSKSTSGG